MKRRTLPFVLFGSALALAATTACGSSSNGDLFGAHAHGTAGSNSGGSGTGAGGTGAGGTGAGGTGAGGSSGSGTGGSGTGGSGTGGSGTGGSGTGGSGTGGSGTGGSGTGGSGGSSGSGGSGFGGSGGSSGSGGSGGAVGSIACGSSTCTAGPDFCCYYVNAQQPACNPVGTKCSPSTDLYCDGPEDCPAGSVCCGQLVQVGTSNDPKTAYNEVRCAQSCDYSKYQREFCHDTSQCTGGRTCQSSQILSTYKVCG